MSQTKKFSLEERVEMVLYCIANNYDYSETAVKYQVKYTNLYNWVKRYEEKGKAGLEDRRGQRKAKQESRTPEEEAQIRIAQLEEQVKYQQMEIDLLKKVKELERRDR
ncbi:MAG: helix-turn-helix domain-containing protein [Enterococcus avium]|uniref:helix-turn-helix domain-containing protein n=1 Tax=Enterococcus avium TaxID=33945 RepID=UPI000A88032C|nr:helix-turn-helix domain-containing protein [Enterococcus avium]MDU3859419.1 helix-turn-helix domain-containing protein [Enterococcus avium]